MARARAKNERPCVYCGNPAKGVRRGEHILPDVIGGGPTINEVSEREVCHTCNNGKLSLVDRELCNRSYLSVVASQEIDGKIWQVWDVDHASDNLLIESRPEWKDGALARLFCWPQMTFESHGPELRGDVEEARRFGAEDFGKVLAKAIHCAFERYSHNEPRVFHFERMYPNLDRYGYRYAPRIYTPRSIQEIARNIHKQSFVLRYSDPEDRRRALLWLSRQDGSSRFQRWTRKPSSRMPPIGLSFDAGLVVQALIKIGVNLIAAYCPNTPVIRL